MTVDRNRAHYQSCNIRHARVNIREGVPNFSARYCSLYLYLHDLMEVMTPGIAYMPGAGPHSIAQNLAVDWSEEERDRTLNKYRKTKDPRQVFTRGGGQSSISTVSMRDHSFSRHPLNKYFS
jgi:hypothetical protein